MVNSQAATIAALRARLVSLGGATAAPRARPVPPEAGVRAAALGFIAETCAGGTTFVRRTTVDLAPYLEVAGVDSTSKLADLLTLFDHPCAPGPPCWQAEGVGVLDIESLGLRGSGVMAFLVAVGIQHGTRLDCAQYLLADPGEEGALLIAVAETIAAHRLWLTYNGRSFDIPVLSARCTLNRIDPGRMQPRLHGDLLGPVRRLFRERLGPCTLRHAEMSLLNHHRVDDVPGFEAPGRYRAWLRGARPAVLDGVVEHNLQDIVSTVVLAARLAAHVGGERVRPAHAADAYQLARHLERLGVAEAAEVELRATIAAGVDPWARRATHRLALALQRRGAMDEALEIWRRLHREDPHDLRAARGFAIRLERRGDVSAALDVCERVERARAEWGPWWDRVRGGGDSGAAEWRRREARLRRRFVTRMSHLAGGDVAAAQSRLHHA